MEWCVVLALQAKQTLCKPADATTMSPCVNSWSWLTSMHAIGVAWCVFVTVCVCQSLATHCMWLFCLHVVFVGKPSGYTLPTFFACIFAFHVQASKLQGMILAVFVMTYCIVCFESHIGWTHCLDVNFDVCLHSHFHVCLACHVDTWSMNMCALTAQQ